jgi:hypothetical protein
VSERTRFFSFDDTLHALVELSSIFFCEIVMNRGADALRFGREVGRF